MSTPTDEAEHDQVLTVSRAALELLTSGGAVRREGFSPGEIAKALGVSRATVYTWMDSGILPSAKLGGRRLIGREALLAALAAREGDREVPGPQEASRQLLLGLQRVLAQRGIDLADVLRELGALGEAVDGAG